MRSYRHKSNLKFVSLLTGLVLGLLMGSNALALVISVVVELAIILWWSLPIVRTHVMPAQAGVDDKPLTYPSLVRFYWPLDKDILGILEAKRYRCLLDYLRPGYKTNLPTYGLRLSCRRALQLTKRLTFGGRNGR